MMMSTTKRQCHLLKLKLLLLLALACLYDPPIFVAGQQQEQHRDDRGNLRFDPDNSTSTSDCSIPPYIDPDNFFQSKDGLCDATTSKSFDSLSDDELQALAVAYAPVIFFHPLEKYTMSGVNYTLPTATTDNSGRIYRQTKEDRDPYLIDSTLNTTLLFQTTKDPIYSMNPNSFYFETDRAFEMLNSTPTALYGDAYDIDSGSGNGRSKAPLYWNVYDSGNSTLTFNYWMYFPYNGEGGMGVLGLNNGTQRYVPFTLKPYGIHEGDWESINVMVCAPRGGDAGSTNTSETIDANTNNNNPPPLAVKYHQHEWSEIADCTKGECKFYKDSSHPVGFTALNSHATYSQSSKQIVYTEINIGFFYSLQAFVVVDRTVYKKPDNTYNYFFPTSSNLERFQDPNSLTMTEGSDPNHFWQAYGGKWGNSEEIQVARQQPNCLNAEQSGYIPCPTPEEDPIFDFVMQIMDVRPSDGGLLNAIQSATGQVADLFSRTSNSPLGPGAKGFWERWIEPRNSPVWASIENKSLTAVDYCAEKLYVDDTYREPVAAYTNSLLGTITWLIVVTAGLTLLTISIPLVSLYFQDENAYQPILFSDEGDPEDPHGRGNSFYQYKLGAMVFSIFFVQLLCSGITFAVKVQGLLRSLQSLISSVNWVFLFGAIQSMGLCVLVVNTLLLLFLWLQVFEMQNMIQAAYHHMTEKNPQAERLSDLFEGHDYVKWNPRRIDVLFRCSFAILFLSLLFSLICFLVGIAAMALSYTMVGVCNKVVGSLDEYCFDLDVIGIDKVRCGDDFQGLCNDWADESGKPILWSGYFVFASHFYLVAATGFAAHQRRSLPLLLVQYDLVHSLRQKQNQGIDALGSEEQETPVS